MLVAKLRHKADRDLKQQDAALKDSKLTASQISKTTELEQSSLPIESTGGATSPFAPQPRQSARPKWRPDTCPHPAVIGDKCVANCKLCGIFIPKVSLKWLKTNV